MRKIISILIMLSVFNMANAYEVCGPEIATAETGYATIKQIGEGGIYLGYWAVGSNCGDNAGEDIPDLCDTVMVGGAAFCGGGSSYYGLSADLDEGTAKTGPWCFCRRTKVNVNGALSDSIGMAVQIGAPAECRANCARLCAESVATNYNGMRNPIMMLPAF